MLTVPCFGRNVYIDSRLVGYITQNPSGEGEIYISGHRFCKITDHGVISINGEKVGYVEDGGDIYLHDKLVGEITPQYDFRFFGNRLNGD